MLYTVVYLDKLVIVVELYHPMKFDLLIYFNEIVLVTADGSVICSNEGCYS